MQLLQVRQVLGEQTGQARGVPEMFGQRTTSGFPQSMDPMHVPGSSGEYVGHPQPQTAQSGLVGKQKSWDGKLTSTTSQHGLCRRAWNSGVK
jgi:hypothetical protein